MKKTYIIPQTWAQEVQTECFMSGSPQVSIFSSGSKVDTDAALVRGEVTPDEYESDMWDEE